jgi:hypothetical protein
MSSLLPFNRRPDPIYGLLSADDDEEKDRLTEKWKDNKLQELSFVGIVVSSNAPFIIHQKLHRLPCGTCSGVTPNLEP